VTQLVDHLLGVTPAVAYSVIGALVFAEAALFVGFVLPGETAVIIGGVLAAEHRLSLAALLVLVVGTAILGDTVGYQVGKHAGPRVLATRPLRRYAGRLDGAREFLRSRGGSAVLLARFTAFLRAVMPALAGLSRMPYPRFLVWNAAGGLIWGVGVVLLGFFAGTSYPKVEQILGRGSAVLLTALLSAAAVVWFRRRYRTKTRHPRVDESRRAELGPATACACGRTTARVFSELRPPDLPNSRP
jgi:membrane-associated protein